MHQRTAVGRSICRSTVQWSVQSARDQEARSSITQRWQVRCRREPLVRWPVGDVKRCPVKGEDALCRFILSVVAARRRNLAAGARCAQAGCGRATGTCVHRPAFPAGVFRPERKRVSRVEDGEQEARLVDDVCNEHAPRVPCTSPASVENLRKKANRALNVKIK